MVHAQASKPDLQSCPSLKTAAYQNAIRLCTLNSICGFVLTNRDTCEQAQSFIDALAVDSINIHPNRIWKSAMPEHARALEQRPGFETISNYVQSLTQDATGNIVHGKQPNGLSWVASAKILDGRIHGPAYVFISDGSMRRGLFQSGQLQGPGETLTSAKSRFLGLFSAGKLHGPGLQISANGSSAVGDYREGYLERGNSYRADGSLHARGRWAPNGLILGEVLNSDGKTIAGYFNTMIANEAKITDEQERSCRAKLNVQDKQHESLIAAMPSGNAVQALKLLARVAQERIALLKTQCSNWSNHLRLVWDAEETLENARADCETLGAKAQCEAG